MTHHNWEVYLRAQCIQKDSKTNVYFTVNAHMIFPYSEKEYSLVRGYIFIISGRHITCIYVHYSGCSYIWWWMNFPSLVERSSRFASRMQSVLWIFHMSEYISQVLLVLVQYTNWDVYSFKIQAYIQVQGHTENNNNSIPRWE
jgi:hypothetical protein